VAYAAGNVFAQISHNFLVEIEQARDRAQAPRQTTLCMRMLVSDAWRGLCGWQRVWQNSP
jgi:hypothetical protein